MLGSRGAAQAVWERVTLTGRILTLIEAHQVGLVAGGLPIVHEDGVVQRGRSLVDCARVLFVRLVGPRALGGAVARLHARVLVDPGVHLEQGTLPLRLPALEGGVGLHREHSGRRGVLCLVVKFPL